MQDRECRQDYRCTPGIVLPHGVMIVLVLGHRSKAEVSATSLWHFHYTDRDPDSLPLRVVSSANAHSRNPSTQESRDRSRPISRRTSKETHLPQSRHSGQPHPVKSVLRKPSDDSDSEADVPAANLLSRRLNPALTRRRPSAVSKPGQARKGSRPEDDDEDDEDSPLFLPFANTSASHASPPGQHPDPSATLRGGFGTMNQPAKPALHRRGTSERVVTAPSRVAPQPQPLTSSASSASSGPTPNTAPRHRHRTSHPTISKPQTRLTGPMSPHQPATLEAAGLSPCRRPGKEGSDGTPSMGSSFSDLDDASVTQSALEEALMSNMRNNGGGNASVASRVSGLSQALRSRYFDVQGRRS